MMTFQFIRDIKVYFQENGNLFSIISETWITYVQKLSKNFCRKRKSQQDKRKNEKTNAAIAKIHK